MIMLIMTLTEGQGHKGQGQRSQKVTLPYFSETIEATVTKFGTKVLCDNALNSVYNTDLDQRSRSKRSRSKVKIATLPYISETIEAKVNKFGTKVLCDNAL